MDVKKIWNGWDERYLLEKPYFRQVLIDNRTYVRYNNCIATLGRVLNSNSNKQVYGQFDFPFGWPLRYRRRRDARKIRSWLTRFYYWKQPHHHGSGGRSKTRGFLYGKISEWRCDSVKKKQDLSHKRWSRIKTSSQDGNSSQISLSIWLRDVIGGWSHERRNTRCLSMLQKQKIIWCRSKYGRDYKNKMPDL